MKKVLVLSFSDLARDPRVNRQIRALAEHCEVTAVGLGDPEIENVRFIRIARAAKGVFRRGAGAVQLLLHRFERYYWQQPVVTSCLSALRNVEADAIVANDVETLPLALRISNGAKVILDAHEYAPAQFADQLRFRLFFKAYNSYLCRRYIPDVDGMMTVSDGLANLYEEDTGTRPVVVTNAPDYEHQEPRPVHGEAGTIRLVHHGSASPSRRIERMIEMLDSLDDRFELDLLLVPSSKSYMERLVRMGRGNPRVRFRDPVPMRELPRFLNQYDIGVYILPPSNLNSRFALPNKLFEFIQARLAVAVGPSPDMAKVVRENDCGIVSEDFSPQSLAKRLRECDAETINHYKWRSHAVARELSVEANTDKILELADTVLEGRHQAHTA